MINYERIGKLLEEYLKVHPMDEGDTYYEHDADVQQGENQVKEELLDIWKEGGGNILKCKKHSEFTTINGECRFCFWSKNK